MSDNPKVILTSLYANLTKDCPINQLGPPYTYHYSDETTSNILTFDTISIDVKSAFPTICKILFGKDHPFVKTIFNIEDKLQKNIYISTTLTEQTKIDNYPYINELNLWSKMLVLSYIYSKYDEVTILEYIKDGAVIKGVPKVEFSEDDKNMIEFISKYEILFHEKEIKLYLNFNKTIITKEIETIKVKGKYKNPPQYLNSFILDLSNGNIYDKKLLQLKEIYNDIFFNILFKAYIIDQLKIYYIFDDSKYISLNGEITKNLSECHPRSYLSEFIYPILSLFRLHNSQKIM